MNKATVMSVKYKPNMQMRYLKQGTDWFKKPKDGGKILGGSNGTNLCLTRFGKADVEVTLEYKGETYPVSIGSEIRGILDRPKITRKLAKSIKASAPFAVEIVEKTGGGIQISQGAVARWLSDIRS